MPARTRPPSLTRIYETVLYAAQLEPVASFYAEVVGLKEIPSSPGVGAAFRLPDSGVLLLFDPHEAIQPGRMVPSHGAEGPGHVAFSVKDLEAWRAHLEAQGIENEQEQSWPQGGRSLYVRDPAGNSVEFVQGEIWR